MNVLKPAVATAMLIFCGCDGGKREGAPAPAPAAAKTEPAPSAADRKQVVLTPEMLKQANLKFVSVLDRSVPQVVRATGRLVPDENSTWRLGAITEGRVITVKAKTGDQVKAGEVLARMHSHDIHESRALYRKALADLQRAQSSLDYARRTRDRTKKLYELKAASLEQLDQSETELKNGQAALKNAEIEVGRTKVHLVDFLQVPLEGPEEHGHSAESGADPDDLIPIRSPGTGTVLTRNITPGAVVNASADLFVISDLNTIWALGAVQEENLAKLRLRMPATVRVQAYPDRTFNGKVTKIEDKLDPETRTVLVRVELDNRAGLLKPEMYATIELQGHGTGSAMFLPQSALQDMNGESVVFIEVSPGTFEPRSVETGRTLDGLVEITRGIKSGDRIVSDGSFILKSQILKSSLKEE